MKYANKLMVVPYVPRIENPAEKQIFTLDQEMESILNDKTKKIFLTAKWYIGGPTNELFRHVKKRHPIESQSVCDGIHWQRSCRVFLNSVHRLSYS